MRRTTWIALAALAACRFDVDGPAFDDAAIGDGGVVDGAASDAPRADAGPCPDDVVARLTIAGAAEPPAPGEPFADVLIGDTVTLSASGSCSRSGEIQRYEWSLSPMDETAATALPDLTSETITLYPTLPVDYTVRLTVRDGGGRQDSVQVFGIRAAGFARLDGLLDIRDLWPGEDDLYLAAKDGAFRTSLAVPGAFVDIAAEADAGSDPPLETELVAAFVAADGSVWFGHKDARAGVWKVDVGQVPPRSTFHLIDAALGAEARVRDIGPGLGPTTGPAADGVAVATDLGLTWSPDYIAFTDSFVPPDNELHAVAAGGGEEHAGASRLYDIDDGGSSVDPYEGVADSKIRTLAVDADRGALWVGSDGNGVARVENATNATVAVYLKMDTALDSDKIRAVAVERAGPFAGDVWVATDRGVGRFKRDRGVWVWMAADHGLAQRTDLSAIAVDEGGGRRAIYAGGAAGLVYIRAP